MTNATCFDKQPSQAAPSLFQDGNLVFQAHHVGWLVTGFFTIVATVTSFWLVNKHLQWYTNKREQRYIVRLLFMVPIYAIISFASYLFWNHSTPLLLIRDGYESTVLTAFFYLLLNYLSPNPDEQRAIFLKVGLSRHADAELRRKGEEPAKWVFPLGFIKSKPADGLFFLQMMKWGVLQYCVIRPLTTLAAVSLNYAGLYCDSSWSPRWGYVYITVIVSLSVSIAMYCLIQLYVPIATYLAPQKPLLKLFAVKAVVFLTFWQATFLSLLSTFGVVKDTKYMTADDINIGIGAILETFEMMCFAFLHIRAFTYKPYRPPTPTSSRLPMPQRTPRLRSLGHAMDFRETFREIWVGWLYFCDRIRGREPRTDRGARRLEHLEKALGRVRPSQVLGSRAAVEEKDLNIDEDMGEDWDRAGDLSGDGPVERRVDVHAEGGEVERQWLGVGDGDGYGYGLGLSVLNRERSDSLELQIARELEKRGYTSHLPQRGRIRPLSDDEIEDYKHGHDRQRSWWRALYSRVSQSGPESPRPGADEQHFARLSSRHRSRSKPGHPKSKSRSRGQNPSPIERERSGLIFKYDYDFDEPPPPGQIQSHRSSRQKRERDQRRRESSRRTSNPLGIFEERRSSHRQEQRQHSRPLASSSDPDPPRAPAPDPDPTPYISPLVQPVPLFRGDSLLNRVFSYGTDADMTIEQGHATDTTQPVLSVYEYLSQDPPQARMTTSPPVNLPLSHVAGRGLPYDNGLVSEQFNTSFRVPPTSSMLPPVIPERALQDSEAPPAPSSHRRESAHTRPPLLQTEDSIMPSSRTPPPPPRPSHRRESAHRDPPVPRAEDVVAYSPISPSPPRPSHRRESANHPSSPLNSMPYSSQIPTGGPRPASPLSLDVGAPFMSSPSGLPLHSPSPLSIVGRPSTPRNGQPLPPETRGLRHSPKSRYNPNNNNRPAQRSQQYPPYNPNPTSTSTSPQAPERTYTRQESSRRNNRDPRPGSSSHRRISAPLESIPQHTTPPPPTSRTRDPRRPRHSSGAVNVDNHPNNNSPQASFMTPPHSPLTDDWVGRTIPPDDLSRFPAINRSPRTSYPASGSTIALNSGPPETETTNRRYLGSSAPSPKRKDPPGRLR